MTSKILVVDDVAMNVKLLVDLLTVKGYARSTMKCCGKRAHRDGRSRRGAVMGVGIAQGFATIGAIGFPGRIDYGAIGTVTNLAARLCGEAKGGEILVSQRVMGALDAGFDAEAAGELVLKGFQRPVPAFHVRGDAS